MSSRVLVEPDSADAEPLRALRLAIEARSHPPRTTGLVFASPNRRDGRSTIAANYALVAALARRPVLLIDADMRNPALHTMFGWPRSPGLVEALQDGSDPWRYAHVLAPFGGLHVLTAGSPLPRPGDVSASPAMAMLLENAYESFGAVIVDSPAILPAADASGLASHPGTEVVLVVSRGGKRRHVINALHRLALTEAKVLGLVVNRDGPLLANL